MTTTAKIFKSGRSQAVRLPKEFRFEGKEVRVSRHGRGVLLKPMEILVFDDEDAKVAGNIRAELELQGRPIGPYDCLIAAQGLRRNLCVVTANIGEFSRVRGLRWENWEA